MIDKKQPTERCILILRLLGFIAAILLEFIYTKLRKKPASCSYQQRDITTEILRLAKIDDKSNKTTILDFFRKFFFSLCPAGFWERDGRTFKKHHVQEAAEEESCVSIPRYTELRKKPALRSYQTKARYHQNPWPRKELLFGRIIFTRSLHFLFYNPTRISTAKFDNTRRGKPDHYPEIFQEVLFSRFSPAELSGNKWKIRENKTTILGFSRKLFFGFL